MNNLENVLNLLRRAMDEMSRPQEEGTQDINLEVGCRVLARTTARRGETGIIAAMLNKNWATVYFKDDGYEVIHLCYLQPTKAATPEAGDFVETSNGFRGTIRRHDREWQIHNAKNGVIISRPRSEFTIIAKGNSHEKE